MSGYEVVKLILDVDQYDPVRLPFRIGEKGGKMTLICIDRIQGEMSEYLYPADWVRCASRRGIDLPAYVTSAYQGGKNAAKEGAALRS